MKKKSRALLQLVTSDSNLAMFKEILNLKDNKKVQKRSKLYFFIQRKENRAILQNLHLEKLKFTYLKILMQLMRLIMLQFDLLAAGLGLIG
jgi:Ni,Fe-hydrogenase I cytochrome b subunit